MKLLFDQNISPKIVKQLKDMLPDSKQVRHLGLENSSDIQIFDYAKNNGYTIVTFYSDFVDLNIFKGFPPKIIWIKTGNLSTKAITELIYKNFQEIKIFLESEENEILEVLN